jgi:pimeloyl-ACP methyl ester carboxylesterase
LPIPVSVVWGMLDGVLPVHQSNDLPPHFVLHLVPGAGHMLAEEAPELVTQIIRRNLR